ncbi:MAG: S8 family serine peptidase [Planctomycetes bacterium]|nr:S8 family serine peptidase [Planctomycetota bacterium]
MRLVFAHTGLLGALCLATPGIAQAANGDVAGTNPAGQSASDQVRTPADDNRLHLKYGVFDPLQGSPVVPSQLLAGADVQLYIVQFDYAFIDADRDAVRAAGGKLISTLPHNAMIVRMDAGQAAAVQQVRGVRWVGAYEPAYRLEGELITDIVAGNEMPARGYNLVMADKHKEKQALENRIVALGGKVLDRQMESLLFTVELTKEQLIRAARLDEVLWIDRDTPVELDMNNARIVQGSNYIETVAGYTGDGNGSGRIRGHVYEGVEFNHPDFTVAMTNVLSGGQAQSHGHCTAGCIFGNGTSAASARGHAPGAQGYYTNYSTVTAGNSRNQVINAVVNTYRCLFTTASWGNTPTTSYTSISADADDIIFDHRIPWTQSQSNQGSQLSRPQAWAKNIFSIGGMSHFNNSNPNDDQYAGASVGPAADGRIKPDLCNFYDSVWTSDRSGSAGYSTGNSFTGFNGTSAATPITAGLNALAIEMYTDHIFCNPPRVNGGTDFENRPYAQTLKALQITNASLYTFGTGTGQATRNQQGWGYGNLQTMYQNRNRMMIIAEDQPIQQGNTHTYYINVAAGTPMLKICMTYLDPAGPVSPALSRINNLNMQVQRPNGLLYWGNNGLKTGNTSTTGGGSDTIDTVEMFAMANPQAGEWRIQITAPTIAQDAHVATAATDATYALVAAGGARSYNGSCARNIPDNDPSSGTENVIPFGTTSPSLLATTFAGGNGLSTGSTIYFDFTPTANTYWDGLDLNTGTSGELYCDVYIRTGTYVGNTTSMSGWTARCAGIGTGAGLGNPSKFDFNAPLFMSAGVTYGCAIVSRNYTNNYTNGANTYSNADITIDTGAASSGAFSGSQFSPRTANMNVRYRPDVSAWHNQLYQCVLRCQDLGPAGEITGLSFAPATTTTHLNRQLIIRMQNRPAGYELQTTYANNITAAATTVLSEIDYVWHTTADQWNEIGLTTPFSYNGTGDIVVEMYVRDNHNWSSGSFEGFHRGSTITRLYNTGWPFASVPTTGTIDNLGTKMRVEFACPNGGAFGSRCGPISAVPFSTPLAGTNFWFDMLDGVPNSGAIVQLGLNQTGSTWTPSGFTNCFQWNDNVASVFKITNASGFATHALAVPPGTTFNGLKIYGHWYNFDASQPGGLTVSNYIRAVVGSSNP